MNGEVATRPLTQQDMILLVDLNNFARYPSMSIGYLAAVLRGAGATVRVFAPLMVGVGGVTREARVHRFGLLAAKLNHRVATSGSDRIRAWRNRWAAGRLSDINLRANSVVEGFREEVQRHRPRAVLVSTYLMYRQVCEQICAICAQARIPVLIGGPYFTQTDGIQDWLRIPGLSALAAGEVELSLPSILRTLLDGGDCSQHEGVFTADSAGSIKGALAAPLRELDSVPHPDYSDFPWGLYPNRIVPVITGRGCGWGVCTFCSDVASTAGRTYRSRSPTEVMAEIADHHRRYGVSRFVFTDLKLNSNVTMWRTISDRIQSIVPGAKWIGAVHVGAEADNGLSLADLHAAAASGCVRLTTGLETGSQRLSRLMRKGTRVESISRFLRDAAQVGISCRCTMVLGYPGETAEDVHLSAEFLERHTDAIERVSLNRLQITAGTRIHELLRRKPTRFQGVQVVNEEASTARVDHRYAEVEQPSHRKAVMRLLTAVHEINSKSLSRRAGEFEGVM